MKTTKNDAATRNFIDFIKIAFERNPKVKNFEKELETIAQKQDFSKENITKIKHKTLLDISRLNINVSFEERPQLFEFDINKFAYMSILTYKTKSGKYVMEFVGTMFGVMIFKWIENNVNKKIKVTKINGQNSAILKSVFIFKDLNSLRVFCTANGIKIKNA